MWQKLVVYSWGMVASLITIQWRGLRPNVNDFLHAMLKATVFVWDFCPCKVVSCVCQMVPVRGGVMLVFIHPFLQLVFPYVMFTTATFQVVHDHAKLDNGVFVCLFRMVSRGVAWVVMPSSHIFLPRASVTPPAYGRVTCALDLFFLVWLGCIVILWLLGSCHNQPGYLEMLWPYLMLSCVISALLNFIETGDESNGAIVCENAYRSKFGLKWLVAVKLQILVC